ncbi:uncharacterized protein C8Q71DRAFT_163742 [Rhodofomes roseus]|uniref:BTB domain-containing protein n=1 Tax=Rhodofomes roseus TaxID=34475 RepID=A0ABQ8KAT8_9APHY|nr:uncharacterized protein C8Q71DRAFT_163742 [Rhodofomes roseus]KAH9834154.1 hypothetical protein C8Q71DRAFT_163742 [Rhodofomes roseus]
MSEDADHVARSVDEGTLTRATPEVENVDVTRDERHWFEDGNIILVASGSRRGFRVYRGLLTRASEDFVDLLSSPQLEAAEMLDDCPAVYLSDDADELSELLGVVFDGPRYFGHCVPVKFSTVAAVIHLAQKYRMEDLRFGALDILRQHLHGHFEAWVAPERVRDRMLFDIDPIVAVNLAYLTRDSVMLPTALYLCCQLPVHILLRGNNQPGETLTTLDKMDLERCIDGKVRLAAEVANIPWTIATTGLDLSSCTAKGRCASSLRVWAGNLMSVAEASCDALAPCPLLAKVDIEQARAAARGETMCCAACNDALRERELKERRRIFERLTWYMDVPRVLGRLSCECVWMRSPSIR